jgi:uncharacterized membrane protein YeaQ/YmgE (transglycosylase-associated protein family)
MNGKTELQGLVLALLAAVLGWVIKMFHKPVPTWKKRLAQMVVSVPVGVFCGLIAQERFATAVYTTYGICILGAFLAESLLDGFQAKLRGMLDKLV